MKKPPTRKGKAFKIPRPENSRPLIAAAIITIIALACGALALAGRTRPAEERQTPAYVPPARHPISIDAPEGWRVFSYPEVLLDLQVIGPYGGCAILRESEFYSLNQTSSDLAVHQHPALKETAGATPSTIGTAGSRCTAQMTESSIAPPRENASLEDCLQRAFLMSERRNHLTRSTPVNSGMCCRTKAYGTLQSVPPPMSPSPPSSWPPWTPLPGPHPRPRPRPPHQPQHPTERQEALNDD